MPTQMTPQQFLNKTTWWVQNALNSIFTLDEFKALQIKNTQTKCNTLLKLVTTYEGELGALLNQGKTTIMSHPKAIHLQSPFYHTAKERYLGVTLHKRERLSVLPASLD